MGDELISVMFNQLPETIKVLDVRKNDLVIDMTYKIIHKFLIDHAVR